MAYDPQNFESVLLHMRDEYGASVFREPKRMYALIGDLSPGLKAYGNVVRQLAERGALAELEAARNDTTRRDRAVIKTRYVLENELLLSADRAEYFIGVLGALYGFAPLTPQTARKAQTVPPTPQPAPPKPKPGKIVKRGECGDYATFTLDENGVLTISGAGLMWDFAYNGDDAPWADERQDIVHVEIQDDVATIGTAAFADCENLTSVTIPDSVTIIGDNAFQDCVRLKSVTIPDSVTIIKMGAFQGCAELTSVTIPDGVTNINTAVFQDCVRLKSVTIPDSVTSIAAYAFKGCTSLTNVTIPDSVTTIGASAFQACVRLTSVTIPDSVIHIGLGAFNGCISLKSVSLPSNLFLLKALSSTNVFPPSVRITRR